LLGWVLIVEAPGVTASGGNIGGLHGDDLSFRHVRAISVGHVAIDRVDSSYDDRASGGPESPGHRSAQSATAGPFAQAKGYPQSDFSGPVPGSLYYAYLPSTGSYWALATFSLVPGFPFQLGVDMQDGGNTGIFTMPSGASWQVRFGGIPFPCRGNFPDALATVSALSYSPAC
jgi:hypothetical protein